MHKFPEEKPKENLSVIAYTKNGGIYLANYRKSLTWSGYKMQFINTLSRGFAIDQVIGWNRIPQTTDTL